MLEGNADPFQFGRSEFLIKDIATSPYKAQQVIGLACIVTTENVARV
jgi:hypothetical protein